MSNKLNFAIGIPTINRADLLKEALEKYAQTMPNVQIFICDNGNQYELTALHLNSNLVLQVPEKNLGVATSWNLLCKEIYHDYDYALLLNDDIVFGGQEQQVHNFNETFEFDIAISKYPWCCFILPKKTFEEVGKFDETFYPAYFEDNDYHYRMKLSGKKTLVTDFLNPVVYRNSQTIAKEPELNKNFENLKKYYVEKWGGLPGQEKFTTPFVE